MPLIDKLNDTKLKSLKWGSDRPGGGSSNQPYIKTDINNVDRNFNKIRLTKFDDGLIRGGTVGALNASVTDTLRISKFLVDIPKGPLFLAKQVGLQLTNPAIETKRIGKLNSSNKSGFLGDVLNAGISLANKGIDLLNKNKIGPTRIYNLGINTLAQVPLNAFGGHIQRHGLTPIQNEDTKYESVVKENNKNNVAKLQRLLNSMMLYNTPDRVLSINGMFKKIAPKITNTSNNVGGDLLADTVSGAGTFILNNASQISSVPPLSGTSGVVVRATRKKSQVSTNNVTNTIDEYIGGPGSTYGIGKTLIQRKKEYISSISEKKLKEKLETSFNVTTNLTNSDITPKNREFTGLSRLDVDLYKTIEDKKINDNNVIEGFKGVSPSSRQYNILKQAVSSSTSIEHEMPLDINLYKNKYKDLQPFESNTFKTKNITVVRGSETYEYFGVRQSGFNGSYSRYPNITDQFSRIDADIMSIGFRIIHPFNLNEDRIIFNAYMNGLRFNNNPSWSDIKYVGRAESFYRFTGFERQVSFNLDIPCFNQKQLFEKHRALGQLEASTAGNYNDGLLGGCLIKLNVGNYIIGDYAVMNNMSYEIPSDSTWDIHPESKLSMLVKASFTFNIIKKDLAEYQPGQGYYGYLPDTYNGFIPEKNLAGKEDTSRNQTDINTKYTFKNKY